MTWKLTKKAEGMEPLPGIPMREMSEEEFREAAKRYADQGFPARALHGSGFWEHVEEKSEANGASGGDE